MRRIVLCLRSSSSIQYIRAGRSRSIQLPWAITVGTISLNGTFDARSRRYGSAASAPGETAGGCFFGVLSTGASASVPWKVLPTTTASMAPFERAAIAGVIGRISSVPKRAATFCAAGFEPVWAGS